MLGSRWRRAATDHPRPSGIIVTTGLVALACAVAGGYVVQREFNDDRFAGIDPVLDAVRESGPGLSIGLAGVWTDNGPSPVLVSFGPTFGNEVEYAGPVIDEMQRRYETEESFVESIEREDYDLVVVGRGRSGAEYSPEVGWLAKAGWEQVASSDRLALYASPS